MKTKPNNVPDPPVDKDTGIIPKKKIKPKIIKKPGRMDKTVSKFENEYHRFITIKKKLCTLVKQNKKNKKLFSIIPIIQDNVNTINHIVYLSYLLLNFHFIRILDDPNKIIKEKSITQTDIYRVLSAVSTSNGKFKSIKKYSSDWQQSILEFRKHLNDSATNGQYNFPDRSYCCNLINNSAVAILISIKNHFNLNFNTRLAKYLKLKYKEDDSAKAHYWANRILNVRQINPEYPCKFDKDLESEQIIKDCRIQLKITTDNKPNIADNIDIYIPFYRKILLFFKDNEKKLFSLFPLKGELIPSCIKICTDSLYDMIGRHLGITRDEFKLDKRLYWDKCFDLHGVETYKHKFDYEISTNGYEVSILLRIQNSSYPLNYDSSWDLIKKFNYVVEYRSKMEKNKAFAREEKKAKKALDKKLGIKNKPINAHTDYLRSLNWYDYDAHIGSDTGRRRLFSGISGTGNDAITLQCTKKEWNHLTQNKTRVKKINKRKDSSALIKSLNNTSFKTGLVTEFIANLKIIIPKLKEMFKFYSASFYSKIRFTSYINKQRAFNTIVKRLKIGKNTLVCFGDGNVNSNGCCKGQKLPVKGLVNRINREKNITAAYINESNSTKICSFCKHETKGSVKFWKEIECFNGTKKMIKCTIYGLRRCTNNECRIIWDRDHNARINIRVSMESEIINGVRPEYLLMKKSTKIIKKKTLIIKKNVEETV